jgi:TolB-like protein
MRARWLLASILIVAGLTRVAAAADPATVAILYFDYDGKDDDLALLRKGLAQMLITDLLATPAIRVVERDRLQEVLTELKLQATTKLDATSAVKAGKLLGARYLVIGGYFDVMKAFRVDARVVDVETGKVMFSAGASGKPDEFLTLEQKLAGELGHYFTTSLPAVKAPARRALVKPPAALKAATVIAYGKALDALDAGDKQTAKRRLAQVVKDQPDFQLAQLDVDKLMK